MNYDKSKYPPQDTDARVFLSLFDEGNQTFDDGLVPLYDTAQIQNKSAIRATRVLAIGANEEDTANVLADSGFQVVGYDLRTPRLCQLPRYHHAQGDFVTQGLVDFPYELFDHAYSLSAIEHFGLCPYGGKVDPDYDAKAVEVAWELLKFGGTLTLTVPYGSKGIACGKEWRIYDRGHLYARLVQRFSVETMKFFKSHPDCPGLAEFPKDADGIEWVPAEAADAWEPTPEKPHLTVFLKLRKDR